MANDPVDLSCLAADPRALGLRPSVIRSEFFQEYSIKRILIDPDRAWYDLVHTRGVGGQSARRVAAAVAAELGRVYPEAWREALDIIARGRAAQDGLPVWPVGAIVTFITAWRPPQTDAGAHGGDALAR
jgi:hypothetical protein